MTRGAPDLGRERAGRSSGSVLTARRTQSPGLDLQGPEGHRAVPQGSRRGRSARAGVRGRVGLSVGGPPEAGGAEAVTSGPSPPTVGAAQRHWARGWGTVCRWGAHVTPATRPAGGPCGQRGGPATNPRWPEGQHAVAGHGPAPGQAAGGQCPAGSGHVTCCRRRAGTAVSGETRRFRRNVTRIAPDARKAD